ncbi:polymerase [Citrobacter freundii]|uniref:EpsG family protein n=1 Tax=Citrobacter meridianamericanus TaxID=2894201 RepID=UPI001650319E|nr:polymerase [Citrobacter freundii]MBC6505345.1 polymerase [Citrobacter freundii]
MLNKKYVVIFWGGLLSLLCSLPLAIQGGFDDSLVYYEQAIYIWNNGLLDGLSAIYYQTNKFEVGMGLLFHLQVFFGEGRFVFILLNLALVNFLSILIYLKINNEVRISPSLLCASLMLMSYYVFSNNIYVWRSIICLYFLVLMIYSKTKCKKTIFIVLGLLFHYSFILFLCVYYFCRLNKTSKFKFVIISIIISFIISKFLYWMSYASFFVSGGELSLFMSQDNDALKRLIISGTFLFLLLMINLESETNNWVLYKLSLFFCILSILLCDNWQLSWRVFVPAAILGTAIILSNIKRKDGLVLLGVTLSIIPTFRLIYNLLILGHP